MLCFLNRLKCYQTILVDRLALLTTILEYTTHTHFDFLYSLRVTVIYYIGIIFLLEESA